MRKYSNKTLIQAAIEQLATATRKREGDLYELVQAFILSLDNKSGTLLGNTQNVAELARFEDAFLEWLEDIGMDSEVQKHLDVMGDVNDNVIAFHADVNDIRVTQTLTRSMMRATTAIVTRDMLGNGVVNNVSNVLQDVLFDAVTSGGSLRDILKEVQGLIVTDDDAQGLLTRHTTQLSRDLLNGYNGRLHDAVRVKHGLDAFLYINSIIKTSAPQCKRWVKKRILLISEMPAEFRWARKNGSGFRSRTTVANFSQDRGHPGCRHEALPTRSKQ